MIARKYVPILLGVIAVFLLLNLSTLSVAYSLYPARFDVFLLAAICGNLLWFFAPKIFRKRTTRSLRFARALFSPPWLGWTLFMVLYCAFFLVTGVLWLAANLLHPVTFTGFAYHASNGFLYVLTFILVVGVYQALVSWRAPVVPVRIQGLPSEFKGYRIALLSDLHVGLFTRISRLRQFVRIAEEKGADLLAISGDITDDNAYYIKKFIQGMKEIHPHIPVVVILGNHDIYGDPHEIVHRLRDSHIKTLVNQGYGVHRGGKSIWVAGLSDYAAKRLDRDKDLMPHFGKSLHGKPKGDVTVLLAHQPHAFDEAAHHGIELTLSGHTHGGQFGFRSLRWSLAKLFTPWHMGLFKKGNSQMYVTSGAGYWVLPIRFGLPPEVAIIELHPG